MLRASHRHADRKTSTRKRRSRLLLEALESRYAPACSWNSVTHVLTGTGNDAGEIRPALSTVEVWCNGSYFGFVDNNSSLTFNAGAGVNSFTLENPASWNYGTYTASTSSIKFGSFTGNFNGNVQNVNLYTGIGNDNVVVIPGHLFATPTFTVNGQPGTDTLTIDDSGYGSGSSWKITAEDACVGVTNPHCINFGSFNTLAVTTGSGDDFVTIGNNLNTLDGLPHISVVGGAGTDTVVGIDSAYPYGDTYQPGPLSLYMPTKGIVFEYYQVENLTLKTGSGNDSISVTQYNNTLFSTPRVTVNAGGGIDTLTADDSGHVGGKTYNISDVDVCREAGPFEPVTCVGYDSNLENLTVKTSGYSDAIEVSGTGNKLFDKPLVYVDPGAGTNTLTVGDSGNPVAESYQVTESDVILPDTFGQTIIYPVGKIQTLTLKAGAGNDVITVSNSVGTLYSLPDIAIDGGGGSSNIVNVSDAAYIGGDTYSITNNQVSLPNTLGLIATYSNIYALTLYTGSGDDTVNVGNSDGTTAGMPNLNVKTYDGNDTLNIDDHNSPNGATYDVDPYGPNYSRVYLLDSGFIVLSYLMDKVNLSTGAADDVVNVGGLFGTLDGLPYLSIIAGTGANSLHIEDYGYAAGDSYTFHQDAFVLNQLTVGRLGTILGFSNMPSVYLAAGAGDDTFYVCQEDQGLLPGNQNLVLSAGDGTNTLNLYDQKNPTATTYVATSAGTGDGAIAVPSLGFDAAFQSINVVNLYRSLKLGTVVDKSGYNQADYVLNVIPDKPVSNGPPDGQPRDPMVFNPPMPVPPIRDRDPASLAATARSLETASGRRAASPIAIDLILADPLREPVLTVETTR